MNPKFFVRQLAKMTIQHCVLPVCYALHRLRPVEKGTVLFADAHHSARPESMEEFWGYLEKNKDGAGKLTLREFYRDFGKLSGAAALLESVRFMKLYATAQYVVLCDNFLPVSACRKRRGTKVIQLWHACGAFKKFGYDAKDDIPPYYKGNVFANYDLVTVSSPLCVAPFQSAMRQKDGVVRATGISRTDALFSEEYKRQAQAAFAEHYPEAAGKKVVLWVPTFRGNAGVPELLGLSDMQRAARQLPSEYELIISLHPHLLTYADYARYKQPLSSAQLLVAADVVITDYSSILYDAVLLEKKLLIFAPDREVYTGNRGFYMEPSRIPARIVTDPERLSDAILETDRSYDRAAQESFRKDWLSGCDGRASSRIAKMMKLEKEQPG